MNRVNVIPHLVPSKPIYFLKIVQPLFHFIDSQLLSSQFPLWWYNHIFKHLNFISLFFQRLLEINHLPLLYLFEFQIKIFALCHCLFYLSFQVLIYHFNVMFLLFFVIQFLNVLVLLELCWFLLFLNERFKLIFKVNKPLDVFLHLCNLLISIL